MKKIVLSLSVAFLFSGLHAQQAEMNAANAAYNAKNYSEALTQAAQADATLSQDRTISPNEIAQFYFNAGQAAKAAGDMVLAATYFAKLGELESAPYWKAKNKSSKQWEYFFNNQEAQKVVSAGNYGKLKKADFSEKKLQEIAPELNDQANAAMQKGNTAFKSKNYQVAGEEFLKSFYLSKAIGKDNELLKYYSALAFLQTDEKAKAADMLQELVDTGFTGVVTNYYAKDKNTGQKVAFANKTAMDTQVNLGLATEPEVEVTDSLEEDLYVNTTYVWYTLGEWEKALTVGEEGLNKFPSNSNMSQMVSGAYYKTGNSDKFIKNLRAKVANGSATADDYFNLAKSLEDTNGDVEEVKKYYKKAIEVNSDFADAYLNLAFAIIKPEEQYVTIMNENLGSSAEEKKIYNENSDKRKALYKEAVPYLEKAFQLNQDNIMLIKILRTSYDVLGDDDKYIEFKKLYEQKSRQ